MFILRWVSVRSNKSFANAKLFPFKSLGQNANSKTAYTIHQARYRIIIAIIAAYWHSYCINEFIIFVELCDQIGCHAN